MKKQNIFALLATLFSSGALAADWGASSPPMPKTYEVTPSYNWFDPTLRQYYGNRIPGTKTCSSGCSQKYIENLRSYNQGMRDKYKKGLRSN